MKEIQLNPTAQDVYEALVAGLRNGEITPDELRAFEQKVDRDAAFVPYAADPEYVAAVGYANAYWRDLMRDFCPFLVKNQADAGPEQPGGLDDLVERVEKFNEICGPNSDNIPDGTPIRTDAFHAQVKLSPELIGLYGKALLGVTVTRIDLMGVGTQFEVEIPKPEQVTELLL